eukprot:352724-Chlamydomonas_euryale.AAC.9
MVARERQPSNSSQGTAAKQWYPGYGCGKRRPGTGSQVWVDIPLLPVLSRKACTIPSRDNESALERALAAHAEAVVVAGCQLLVELIEALAPLLQVWTCGGVGRGRPKVFVHGSWDGSVGRCVQSQHGCGATHVPFPNLNRCDRPATHVPFPNLNRCAHAATHTSLPRISTYVTAQPHISAIVIFSMKTATLRTLELDTREQALQVVEWLARCGQCGQPRGSATGLTERVA